MCLLCQYLLRRLLRQLLLYQYLLEILAYLSLGPLQLPNDYRLRLPDSCEFFHSCLLRLSELFLLSCRQPGNSTGDFLCNLANPAPSCEGRFRGRGGC